LVGDNQFNSEHLIGYELGYRTNIHSSVLVGVTGYFNQYHDLLSVENVPAVVENSPPPVHVVQQLFLRNGIQARTAGMEISGLSDLRSWWRIRGSYSYMHLDAKRQPGSDDASTVGQLEGDSPRHGVVFQSTFTLPQALEIGLTYRYVSRLPDQKVPAYSTADARIGKRLTHAFELSLVGQNLLQPSHPEYGGDPGPLVGIMRSAYLKLTWSK
jgi:iron complex outermembrane receptor protein